jgi:hypothetical protein
MNNSLNTMSVAEVESTASTVEPTKKVDGAAGQTRQPEYQSPVVEIPMSGQRIHRTSPKLEAAAGQKARRADGYCRVIILRGQLVYTSPCSGGPFPARIHLSVAGNDLESAAGPGSMMRLSGAIPATACTGEWVRRRGKGRRLIWTVG